ncbi:Uncharacterised protein [Achromobacter ruhlandii]|nr:Uncharacterised protein [Achromobacter ruhlandii]
MNQALPRVVQVLRGQCQSRAGRYPPGGVVDVAGARARLGALHIKPPAGADIAGLVIDVLRDAQRQIRGRPQRALGVVQGIRGKRGVAQRLYGPAPVAERAANGGPVPLAAHPSLGVEDVLRMQLLAFTAENAAIAVVQRAREPEIQAGQRLDAALRIAQLPGANRRMALAGQSASLVVQRSVQRQRQCLLALDDALVQIAQRPARQRHGAAALQGAGAVVELARRASLPGQRLSGRQDALPVDEIADGIQAQLAARLQSCGGVIDPVHRYLDPLAALGGRVAVVPLAACLDGQRPPGFEPPPRVVQRLARRQAQVALANELPLLIADALRRHVDLRGGNHATGVVEHALGIQFQRLANPKRTFAVMEITA